VAAQVFDSEFTHEFVSRGGLVRLCDVIRTGDGSTLAYALNALHVIVQQHRDIPAGTFDVDLLSHIARHLDTVNANVIKAALELFLQLNRRQKIGLYDLFIKPSRHAHGDATASGLLVKFLANADVDVHQRALALINALIQVCDLCLRVRSLMRARARVCVCVVHVRRRACGVVRAARVARHI
jgi:hypothetical protein